MDLFTTVARLPYSILGHHRNDTVIADRLNYKYTVILFVIFSIVVSNKQFGSEQIVCWSPGHFVQNYVNYVNQVCWVSNTFYASMDEHLTKDHPDRKSRVLKYYQWVPFILLFQAFLFYTPRLIWRALSTKSGLNIANLVQAARSYQSSEKFQDRDKIMLYMIKSIDQYSYTRRKRKGGISKKCDCDIQQLCFTDASCCCCAGSSGGTSVGGSSNQQAAIGGTYLQDGCLVLRLVAMNSSDLVASELINELWRKYTEKYRTGSGGGTGGGGGGSGGMSSGNSHHHLQSVGSSTIIRSSRARGRDQSPGKDPTEL